MEVSLFFCIVYSGVKSKTIFSTIFVIALFLGLTHWKMLPTAFCFWLSRSPV